jgi:UDP-glucuronate decarboxylase
MRWQARVVTKCGGELMRNMSSIEFEDAKNVAERILPKFNFPSELKFVITGSQGFLGSQLMNSLDQLAAISKIDIRIVCIDNGIRANNRISYKNLKIKYKKADVSDLGTNRAFQNTNYFVHLASIASPVYYREYPLETLVTNVYGTKNILDLAKKYNSLGCLLMSTSEIYGDPSLDAIPTSESYRGNVAYAGPRACYDESKRVLETLAWIYQNKIGIPVSVVRPFNIYGPGMRLDDGRIIPDLVSAILENRDMQIYSDGAPTRSYCYVSDAIFFMLAALFSGQDHPVVNIGADLVETSVHDLARMIADLGKVAGWNGELRFPASEDPEYLVDNPQRRMPDLTKLRKLVGDFENLPLTIGLNRMISHYMEISA